MSGLEINAAVTISGSIPPWVTTELLLAIAFSQAGSDVARISPNVAPVAGRSNN